MSAPTMDPATVPDAWRLDGEAKVMDDALDALVVKRYGNRLEMWTTRGNVVCIPADASDGDLDALESVVREMQAFLEQARNQ